MLYDLKLIWNYLKVKFCKYMIAFRIKKEYMFLCFSLNYCQIPLHESSYQFKLHQSCIGLHISQNLSNMLALLFRLTFR